MHALAVFAWPALEGAGAGAAITGFGGGAAGAGAAAGVVAPVSNNVSLTANVSRTFGHQGGDDFYGTGGFKVSF